MRIDSVVLILYDNEKKFLLQHRTDDAAIMPGYWAFFGGGIKKGETPEMAILRECREELDLELNLPHLAMEKDFKENKFYGHLYIFVAFYDGDKESLKLQEGQGWGWFGEIDMLNLKMKNRDRKIIRNVSQYIDNNVYEECR
jgi:8-oxo-dGTP pyrophosphatase MutT (NUDIX family)